MLYGGEMRILFNATLVLRESLGPEAKIHIEQLIHRLKLMQGQAKHYTEVTQNDSKAKHDVKAKPSHFMISEQVHMRKHKHTSV